jgi:predicted RNA-binding Zn-ribbon protein involved in translation (DUF1610 family)
MKYLPNLFYCPKCGKENYDYKNEFESFIITCVNTRDGYGKFIVHYECPKCGNVLAGVIKYLPSECVEYYKDIITQYNENGAYFDKNLLKFATENLKENETKK